MGDVVTPQRMAITEVDALVEALVPSLMVGTDRFILGIAGPPGAGKSTVAGEVVILVADRVASVVAPLDGFHRSNEELEQLGLLPLKGIPDSFDAAAFVSRLQAVAIGADVAWPRYDRTLEEVIPDAISITAEHRLVVVEGNYLLLDTAPWDGVAPLLDESWYLDVPQDVLIPRLVARHTRHRTEAAALRKVVTTDLPNAVLVAASMEHATRVLYGDGHAE